MWPGAEEEGRKKWEGEESLDAGSVADLARRRTNRLSGSRPRTDNNRIWRAASSRSDIAESGGPQRSHSFTLDDVASCGSRDMGYRPCLGTGNHRRSSPPKLHLTK